SRSQFNLDSLLEIRHNLTPLLGRLPALSKSAPQERDDAAPYRVRVNSPNDRLAMLSESDRAFRQQLTVPVGRFIALEDFTDVLLESVRRSRAAVQTSPWLARLERLPRLAKRIQFPVENQPTAETPAPIKQPNPAAEPVAVESPLAKPLLRYRPETLIAQLEAVPQDSPASDWAGQALTLIRQLADDPTTDPADAPGIVARLQELTATANGQALQLADHATQHEWLRGVQAVERRVAIWRLLFDPEWQANESSLQELVPSETNMMPVLGEVASRLAGEGNGEAWRDYLLLDQIAAAASEGAGIDVKGRRRLAQEVLSRMTDKRLTDAQSEFVQTEALVSLRESLRLWAVGPVDVETLAALVEHYEAHPELRYAAALAQLQQRLEWSPIPPYQQLATHLDQHYRGANMRVALTDDLMNRMMPKRSSTISPVNDRIAGTKVRGRARTTTQVQVRLLPNDKAWQISLEALGVVYSKTRTQTWPARVQNSAKMFYQVRKMILIDGQGMLVAPAKAQARGRNDLVGIETEFDTIPILSYLIRDAARRRHQKSRPKALNQVKAKVAQQARTRMDREANPKLRRLEEKFENNILSAIEELALIAEPLQMYTTEDRAVMELRLANTTQLAANTLRPLAPSDSVASMQLHQSVLNNAAAGLGLNGSRMTLLQLHDFLAEKFGRPGAAPPEDLPARVVIEFAAHDAIHINCQGDRLELVLNVREVAHGRDKIRNFAVHAYFRPVMDGLDVRLVRDGTLQFDGRNLRTGPRVVLHSVFGKLLLKDQEIPLLNRDLDDDPRLEGLMVTQLVIDDGWIGLALGPEYPGRTAWRTDRQVRK
ncbi:MAG: hypothetical protein IH831_10070, partial [Planctomycetes bacterium]|nr:hypothetical protein [Planctomycetota bacterium]